MRSMYNAIHFDMDGVIADTEVFHVAAEQQTCADYNFDVKPNEWGGFKGRTAQVIFEHLISTYGDPAKHTVEQLVDHKTEIFLQMIENNLKPIDGVIEFLEWARTAHPHMALVTSSIKRIQSRITQEFGITDLFDAIVTGDDVDEGKPSPKPYLLSLGRLGVSGLFSVVVEDSHSGILSAQRADCDVLAITTSHPREDLAKSQPNYIVDSYSEARKQLEL